VTLREKSFSAVRWSTLGAVAKLLLSFASIGVLARILQPEDYGLMAMVSVVLGIAVIFADFGVNSAFVQRQDIT
jgi:O-antigen/teichoic acid export membrane protein